MLGLASVNVIDSGDGPEAITGNGEQMEDARQGRRGEKLAFQDLVNFFFVFVLPGRTAEHVDECPQFAQFGAQTPLLGDLVQCSNGHDQTGHEQISDGQRQDQIVAH